MYGWDYAADGYELVEEYELDEEAYEFNLVRVLEKGGRLFYMHDSGCSCPSPFEDQDESDLVEIQSYTSFRDRLGDFSYYDRDHSEFLGRIRRRMSSLY